MAIFGITRTKIDHYTAGKRWGWYVPLLLLGLYMFYAILRFDPNEPAAVVILPMQSLDFGLHEFSHIATAFLPSLLTASAGSLSELILGALLIFGAFKTRCYFAALFCFLWFMLAAQSAGIYMADARAQRLDLVSLGAALSGGDTATHDWNFVFGRLHLLGADKLIGNTVRGIGILAGLFGLGFAVWLLIRMSNAPAPETPSTHAIERDKIHDAAVKVGKDIIAGRTSVESKPLSNLYPGATHGRLADAPEVDQPKSTTESPEE
jgi:hypothetical protein